MRVLFCADPLVPSMPDSAFADEVAAVVDAGLAYDLVSFERLVNDQDARAATRRVRAAETPELAIYRGWMLRPAQYADLYAALRAKGVQLINTPDAYRVCHHLPESYPLIQDVTPRSVWLPYNEDGTLDQIMAALEPFGDQPVILKDFVKSRKHEWHDACYIPQASDRVGVARVVNQFVALQGDDLQEGLVFREYVPFRPIGTHPQSGMPLTLEYRLFVLDGEVLTTTAYWDAAAGADPALVPPPDLFAAIRWQVPSRLFTMDVAQRTDGTWMIVELGDGQVAGLQTLDPGALYRAIADRLGR